MGTVYLTPGLTLAPGDGAAELEAGGSVVLGPRTEPAPLFEATALLTITESDAPAAWVPPAFAGMWLAAQRRRSSSSKAGRRPSYINRRRRPSP